MDRKKLIIAGNYHQFKNYCIDNKLNPRECIYADKEEKIIGLRNVEIIRVGTYWENLVNNSDYLKHLEVSNV